MESSTAISTFCKSDSIISITVSPKSNSNFDFASSSTPKILRTLPRNRQRTSRKAMGKLRRSKNNEGDCQNVSYKYGQLINRYQLLIFLMTYNRVPEEFMKGVFIAPHSFNDPENPEHGEYVNIQLRNDLYYSTLQEISNIEFRLLPIGSKEEWIKVQSFQQCKGELTWFGRLSNDFKKKKGRTLNQNGNRKVDMISCQEWEVAYHRGSIVKKSNYRVHALQTDSDIFKTEVFAPNISKTLKDLLLN